MTVFRVALDVPLPRLFDYLAPDGAASDLGRRVLVPFGKGRQMGVVVEVCSGSEVPAAKLREVSLVLRDLPPLPPDWLALTAFCSNYYHAALGETIAAALPPRLRSATALPDARPTALLQITAQGAARLASLPARRLAHRLLARLAGATAMQRAALVRGISGGAGLLETLLAEGCIEFQTSAQRHATSAMPELLPEQAAAVEAIAEARGFACHLLHGVTGSGKTEVYLRVVERALQQGQQALLLTPEIGLTPQVESRLRQRFAQARIVALHSGVADAERARGFVAAMSGEADIVVGTRLAVFTPLPRLGAIVVDEEHDASFKQQDGIRYHARDLAVWRAKQRGVAIVLGSATPSLESWQHACAGRYRLLSLTRRAAAQEMPRVGFVDVRGERLQEGLSARLLAAFEQRLVRGEQALLFLNRRGYAPTLACEHCGWVAACGHCSANMVVHLAQGRLRCHHCGSEAAMPHACPDCGNLDILPVGRGTQRLEAALVARFPGARVLRVDRDSASSPRRWQALLEGIRSGQADILVGTQMLAKGHDFPRLTLVGVMNADASLYAADFRAPERLFSQLMQVGGRSGRADLPGEVLIQTAFPEHPLYRALAAHDYPGFAASALEERRVAGFPPASFQALLRAEAPQLDEALVFLREASNSAVGIADAVTIYDAVPMRLARRADMERAQLLVQAPRRDRLHAFLAPWMERLRARKTSRRLRWHLDVDPLEL